jgi:hypothetical protein
MRGFRSRAGVFCPPSAAAMQQRAKRDRSGRHGGIERQSGDRELTTLEADIVEMLISDALTRDDADDDFFPAQRMLH